MSLDEVKYQVAVANRILAELGLATGITSSVGHASMRVPEQPDRFVVKGRGYDLDIVGLMRPEEMVVCDLEGRRIEAPAGVSQCYEVKMHSCIYRAHPNVQSVVHVHPRFTILMSVLEKRLRPMSNSGGKLVRPAIPIYPHNKLILTDQDGSEVAELMGRGNAVLLKGHGAVTAGTTLEEAVTNMAQLEEQAMLNTFAFGLMGREHPYISDEMLDETANQPPFWQVPHFDMAAPPVRSHHADKHQDFRGHGLWAHYVDKVTEEGRGR
ncbi:MAG: class II aldolase/adducin family protein [Chloroflexota bacterium]|nr:class II aldolase/adducin family protein [Chloroflexota bacterium]